jgi:hypothetical protein
MIVREMFSKVTQLKSDLKLSLMDLKGKTPKWRTTREEFSKVKKVPKTNLYKFLTDSAYVPTDGW